MGTALIEARQQLANARAEFYPRRQQTRFSAVAIMDRTVARLNIEYLRKRLAGEIDDVKRQMILRLLAEEEEKLAAINSEPKKRSC